MSIVTLKSLGSCVKTDGRHALSFIDKMLTIWSHSHKYVEENLLNDVVIVFYFLSFFMLQYILFSRCL